MSEPSREVAKQPERCPWCGAIEQTSCEVCDSAIETMRSALANKDSKQ